MANEFLSLRDPWQNLRLVKGNKVDIVPLLAPFKKIIVDPG